MITYITYTYCCYCIGRAPGAEDQRPAEDPEDSEAAGPRCVYIYIYMYIYKCTLYIYTHMAYIHICIHIYIYIYV